MIEIKEKIKSLWIMTEGMAGTENQCIGVAEALGITPIIHRVDLRFPWNILSPVIGFEGAYSFTPALNPPWPDVLIASGRKAIAAARYIKRASGGKTFTVFLQDPRVNPVQFDLVAVPAHDPTRGDNVIVTTAAPNRITQEKLDEAVRQFPEFEKIPQPRVAVLIGGSSKSHTMTPDVVLRLGNQLNTLRAAGFGLMITASRRTGEENRKVLEKVLANHPLPDASRLPSPSRERDSAPVSLSLQGEGLRERVFFWNNEGKNPYHAFLGWADFVIVTSDSVSMISESLTAGKPTYIIPLPVRGKNTRLSRFLNGLLDQGIVRTFHCHLEHYTYTPLNDAEKVAVEIKKRLKIDA